MEQRDYIEQGIAKKGSLAALGRFLDQGESPMRSARNHKCGLPVYACIKLAELIGATPLEVIAASELVTEKREERRAVFLPFVQQFGRHGHQVIIGSTSMLVASKMASDMGDFIMCLI